MTPEMRPLRIGIVFDDTLDRPDGVQQYVLLLGRWLSEHGHSVYYLVGNTKRNDIENLHSMSRTMRVAFNANILSMPLPASRRRARSVLEMLQLDVLHVQMPYSPLMAGRVIARRKGETLVGTFHILPYGRIARVGSSLLGTVQRKSLSSFDEVMATSPAAASFAEKFYDLSPTVVPNPVDVKRYTHETAALGRSSSIVHIVFLGRLVERKGAYELVKAFRRMQELGVKNTHLHIGGKGPLLQKLQRYIAKHNLGHIVSFDGFINEKDKPRYLASADIAVFPAMSGESFGIVLTEAMAANAGVVLGGDNPGYRSVLGEWPECLLQADNSELFAHSLKMFVDDKVLRSRLHKLQQKAVDQYDIDIVGAKVVAVYRGAILRRLKKMQ